MNDRNVTDNQIKDKQQLGNEPSRDDKGRRYIYMQWRTMRNQGVEVR